MHNMRNEGILGNARSITKHHQAGDLATPEHFDMNLSAAEMGVAIGTAFGAPQQLSSPTKAMPTSPGVNQHTTANNLRVSDSDDMDMSDDGYGHARSHTSSSSLDSGVEMKTMKQLKEENAGVDFDINKDQKQVLVNRFCFLLDSYCT